MGKGIITRRGLDTSDATATADKILQGFTAYANGAKLTGALPEIVVGQKAASEPATGNSEYLFPGLIGKTNFIIFMELPNNNFSDTQYPVFFVKIGVINRIFIANGSNLRYVDNLITFYSESGYVSMSRSSYCYFLSSFAYNYIGW